MGAAAARFGAKAFVLVRNNSLEVFAGKDIEEAVAGPVLQDPQRHGQKFNIMDWAQASSLRFGRRWSFGCAGSTDVRPSSPSSTILSLFNQPLPLQPTIELLNIPAGHQPILKGSVKQV